MLHFILEIFISASCCLLTLVPEFFVLDARKSKLNLESVFSGGMKGGKEGSESVSGRWCGEKETLAGPNTHLSPEGKELYGTTNTTHSNIYVYSIYITQLQLFIFVVF